MLDEVSYTILYRIELGSYGFVEFDEIRNKATSICETRLELAYAQSAKLCEL